MVEQAVQTGSLDNLNAKKLLPGKGTAGMQLNGRPAQPSSKTASGTYTLGPLELAPCAHSGTLLSGVLSLIKTTPKPHVLLQGWPVPHAPVVVLPCCRRWVLLCRRLPHSSLLRLRCSSAGSCASSRAGERREQKTSEEAIR